MNATNGCRIVVPWSEFNGTVLGSAFQNRNGFNNDDTTLFSTSALTDTTNATDTVYARFTLSRPAGAVPEPSTWAMMLLGFGAIGAALRRRRSTGRAQLA